MRNSSNITGVHTALNVNEFVINHPYHTYNMTKLSTKQKRM